MPTASCASPFVRDPDDPSKITVWGDLADIDNEPSHAREEQWRYWAVLVARGGGAGLPRLPLRRRRTRCRRRSGAA